MKVFAAPRKSEKFKPVVLTITLETREELLDMYVRHIIQNDDIKKIIQGSGFAVVDAGLRAVGTPALLDAVSSIGNAVEDVPLLGVLQKEILK